jgi:hypothetical protein
LKIDLFRALRNRGWTGIGLANVMPWFSEPGKIHRDNAYNSNNLGIIAKQCELMQYVGIQGVIMTTQGSRAMPFEYQTALSMQQECENRGMLFCLLLDQWLVKSGGKLVSDPTQEVINQLKAWPQSKAYVPEKYVLDFLPPEAMVDWAKVQTSTGYTILNKHKGYSWPEVKNNVATLARDNANAAMKIPGISMGFNDAGYFNIASGVRDYSQSVWGGKPARVLDHMAGNTWMDQVDVTPVTAKYVGLVTWNDYDEGTAFEQFSAVLKGIRLQ